MEQTGGFHGRDSPAPSCAPSCGTAPTRRFHLWPLSHSGSGAPRHRPVASLPLPCHCSAASACESTVDDALAELPDDALAEAEGDEDDEAEALGEDVTDEDCDAEADGVL